MKKIETQRTKLRRITLMDFDNMRKLETNALIMKFIPARIPQTEDQTRARLEGQVQKQASLEPFGVWVVESKDGDSFLGWFMLMPNGEKELELGFMLVQEHWNKGFATEISRALIDYASKHLNIERLIAQTTLNNTSSKGVIKKLGFEWVGTIFVPEKVLGGEIELDSFVLPLKSS